MDEWTVEPRNERRRQAPPPVNERRRGQAPADDSGWERDALRDIALEGIRERRRSRRWTIFFRLVFLSVFLLVFGVSQGWFVTAFDSRDTEPHTAVVRVTGFIGPGGDGAAEDISAALRSAFEHKATRAVILHVNSPGGSPVHAAQINDTVRALRDAHDDIPLYVVADDVFASAAYYLAVSADAIYVNPATIMGSIGVLFNGFGFDRAIDNLGVERRLFTAGEQKGALDPFSPLDAQAVDELQALLDETHALFIDAVRTGRGDRLNGDDDALFSGRVWSGTQGVALGLADDFGSLDQVARNVVGVENRVDFTPRRSLLDEVLGRASLQMVRSLMQWTGADGLRPLH